MKRAIKYDSIRVVARYFELKQTVKRVMRENEQTVTFY